MPEKILKYKLKLNKTNEMRFISHLDWQEAIQKTLRRLGIRLVLSEGFAKLPKISYSPALPIFLESICELVVFQSYDELDDDFARRFNQNSPKGMNILEFLLVQDFPKSLDTYIQWAKYEAQFRHHVYKKEEIRYIIDKCLSSDEFLIAKKTKKGIQKTINYRKSIQKLEFLENDVLSFILKAGQSEEIPPLRADEFLKILFEKESFSIKRVEFFDINMEKI